MAQYRVGDRLLSQEEYNEDLIFKWKLVLFSLGLFVAWYAVQQFVPIDWDKWIRFTLIAVGGSIIGGGFACFARQIDALSAWVLRAAVLYIVGAVIWSLI